MVNNLPGNVFINCPFDKTYEPIFRAIVFAIVANNYTPHCALERSGSDIRINKICQLISCCKYGIHDISLDDMTASPRLNMAFELGLFQGCKRFGQGSHKSKDFLVLEKEKYRYHKFISDLSGIDIKSHKNDPLKALVIVNNWLGEKRKKDFIRNLKINNEYKLFEEVFPKLCSMLKVDINNYSFMDLHKIMALWLNSKRDYFIKKSA